ncbi:MAG: beta-lactamase family protein [Clostridiales bacterium]|nr:beta-lactamase family protein [Clostridiales bacterium]
MVKETLDRYLKEALFLNDLPGLAVGISLGEKSPLKNKNMKYQEAAGYQNFMTKKTLKKDTIFHAASITKLLVGTSIMLLHDRGSLELDAAAIRYIPWLFIDDKRYKRITLRHLLTHTAGVNDVSDYGWNRPDLDEEALKRYIQSDEVAKSKLLWSPEENRFRYSNIGFEILGAVIAQVSGMSFEDFVMQNLLEPLEMKNTNLLTFQRSGGSLELEVLEKANVAMPHTKDAEKHIILEKYFPYNRAHGPSSTMTTNLEDLEKWARAHLERRILTHKGYEQMWKPQSLVPNNGEHIGLSWFIREQNGYTLYGHEGSDDGFRTSFWICPELDMHIAVESNITQAPLKRISKEIFNIMTSA